MTEDESHDDDAARSKTRRRFVASGVAGWATVSLAGCSRVLDPSSRDGGTGGSGGSDGGSDGGSGGSDGGSDGGSGGSDGGSDGSDGGSGGSDGGGETTTPGNTTVTNETTTTEAPGEQTEAPTTTGECASIGRFAGGMEVGLHVTVFDDLSGDPLGDDAVDRVTVEFPDADFGPLELNWEGDHEAYDTTTWGGLIETSEATESGTYRYEITVEGEEMDPQTVVDEFTIV